MSTDTTEGIVQQIVKAKQTEMDARVRERMKIATDAMAMSDKLLQQLLPDIEAAVKSCGLKPSVELGTTAKTEWKVHFYDYHKFEIPAIQLSGPLRGVAVTTRYISLYIVASGYQGMMVPYGIYERQDASSRLDTVKPTEWKKTPKDVIARVAEWLWQWSVENQQRQTSIDNADTALRRVRFDNG